MARYPNLAEWFAEPLTRRVGRLLGEDPRRAPVTDPVSYNARHYLTFLGVTGRVAFDWDWLLALPALNVWVHARALNLPILGVRAELTELGTQVGFQTRTASRAAEWALSRMLLHGGVPPISELKVADFAELLAAMDAFGERPDRPYFHGDDARWASKRRNWGSQAFLLQLMLYHAGHIPEIPKEPLPTTTVWPVMPSVMAETIDRYLEARAQLDRPATIQNIRSGLRRFHHLADGHPAHPRLVRRCHPCRLPGLLRLAGHTDSSPHRGTLGTSDPAPRHPGRARVLS